MFSRTTGQARLALRPSKKSIKHMVNKVHALTDRSRTWQETTTPVGELNRALVGWANYFSVGSSSQPIARSTATQRCGCAGGCGPNTRSGDAEAGLIHSRISTGTSGSYV
jgi:hypothetical protein